MRIKAILSIAAIASVSVSGFAIPASAQGGGSSEAQQCEVVVDRSQASDIYDLTRQVYGDGNCICYLYTGPAGSQSQNVENRINALTRSRTCPEARVMAVANGNRNLWLLIGGAGAAGAAIAFRPTSP